MSKQTKKQKKTESIGIMSGKCLEKLFFMYYCLVRILIYVFIVYAVYDLSSAFFPDNATAF